jgi:hypothetical protein
LPSKWNRGAGVGLGLGVALGLAVGVGVGVGVRVGVGDGERVGAGEGVRVGAGDGLRVGLGVAVGGGLTVVERGVISRVAGEPLSRAEKMKPLAFVVTRRNEMRGLSTTPFANAAPMSIAVRPLGRASAIVATAGPVRAAVFHVSAISSQPGSTR